MKKSLILAAACAFLMAQAATAQNTDATTTYVEDNAQGIMLNKFSDNWFISAEGGVGIGFEQYSSKLKLKDRIAPAASVYFGKWFSPIIGVRLGANWTSTKGLSEVRDFGRPDESLVDGLYRTHFSELGGVGDVLINLTNWWCGYRQGRVYNATFYLGGSAQGSFAKKYADDGEYLGWKSTHDFITGLRGGLINSFRITPAFELALDLRFSAYDGHRILKAYENNRTTGVLQAFVTATYYFKKRDWNGPMVPLCPPAENCDPVREQLADATMRISELERQLDACQRRPAITKVVEQPAPAPTVIECEAPLATVYFPIGVSKITQQDSNVLSAVAQVMIDNPSQKYVVTGWADNYTGSSQINQRLRKDRAKSVADKLKALGVPADQYTVSTNDGNLSDLGEKFVALDRAVTIEKAK